VSEECYVAGGRGVALQLATLAKEYGWKRALEIPGMEIRLMFFTCLAGLMCPVYQPIHSSSQL
jgi:hypothetical protein